MTSLALSKAPMRLSTPSVAQFESQTYSEFRCCFPPNR